MTIETIGYGGKKPDDFFAELEALNPDIVVDVREKPHRAFLGVYTMPQLQKQLGSRYIWIKELGNKTRMMPPKLVNEEAGLKKLHELSLKHERIVLLCAEKLEENCHRGYVKKRFLQLSSGDSINP